MLGSLLVRLRVTPDRLGIGISVLIGIAAGLGAAVFQWALEGTEASLEHVRAFLEPGMGRWAVIVLPAIGGLLVGPITFFFAKEVRGHGVPEIMMAVRRHGGRIRPRVAFAKIIASALTIGSGGSAGREGPIAQIGAAVGSSVGGLFRAPADLRKTFVACGAAAGIAATFNAPIGGVFFAIEVILGALRRQSVVFVVLSCVTATAISRALIGDDPAFSIPEYAVSTPWELLLFLALGALSAPVGRSFVIFLSWCEDLWEKKLRFLGWSSAAMGGAIVGLIGVFYPGALGGGYHTIEATLYGRVAFQTALILIAVKILASSTTLASGGSGGVFAPALFLGATLGCAFGIAARWVFPGIETPVGAYSLVGMGAVFAAAAHAPLTAILILFEMTGDYRMILPIMAAVVMGITVAVRMNPESIYTEKLRRMGFNTRTAGAEDPLRRLTVQDVMIREVETLHPKTRLSEVRGLAARGLKATLPVADDGGHLLGLVTAQELNQALAAADKDEPWILVHDFMRRTPITARPDEQLDSVVQRMREKNEFAVPVVGADGSTLVGFLTYGVVVEAYRRSLLAEAAD